MKFSVVTAVRNGEAEIERTMRSVLRQTYTAPFEYILVDGASTDQTLAIAKSFVPEFERRHIAVKLISEPDEGIYDAMNKGIEAASGDVIGLINCGDIYLPNALAETERVFESGCDLSYGNVLIRRGKRTYIKPAKNYSYPTSRGWNHPTQFVSKRIYDSFRYSLNCGVYADLDFFFKVKYGGWRIQLIPKVLAEFAFGGASNKKTLPAMFSRIKIRCHVYRRNGFSPLYLFECIGIELVKYLWS
ncbi:MAG TPA: glycosyltransferase family 2 protein [Oscillospiraceae bacterium]|nr:glycosyltransferase family 2 protein [Oscillospiraceae bacterium]HPF56792.1 glycosyltransferase family 2 protein [Clostridiales bacterium]HPK36384.1 glycosyltransferase family 2 protein [Oscillospiraceae bacterium]HPR75760.1 glycosyltransferase family 2 protein [Oscillospiraceae bacterium]